MGSEMCIRDRDVFFHEYMADQKGTVAKIYDHYGWKFTDQARSEIRGFLDSHQRGKHGRVRYKLKEHFGVHAEEIRERFDFYFKKFPVEIEV